MGPSWGAIGWADPGVVAHLRFLEDARYQRSEFEDERLGRAAEALEERAADHQRWRERRPEHDDPHDSPETDEDLDGGLDGPGEEEGAGEPA